MSFDPATLAVMAITKGGMSAMTQLDAQRAVESHAEAQQALLSRRESAHRDATKENSKRLRENKRRAMAEVRVAQAASGFAGTGTPLAVLGAIESRFDERINEVVNQGYNRIAEISSQKQMIDLAVDQRREQMPFRLLGTALTTVGNTYSAYRKGYDNTGKDPWNIFK